MNKVIASILVIITIIVTLFTVNKVFRKGDIDTYSQTQFVNEDGLIYTQREWSWSAFKTEETPVLTNSLIPTEQVGLLLDGNTYFILNVPNDRDYFYDFGKAVYAVDGSYCAYIVKANASNLSSLAGIKDSENITKSSITNKVSGKKDYRIIASLLGDTGYGVVCEIYRGDEIYSTIYNNFLTESLNLIQIDIPNVQKLGELPKYAGIYTHQININKLSLSLERYLFEDGYLYKTADYSSIEDIKTKYLPLLQSLSGHQEIREFSNGDIFYFESGDCYLGLLKYNSNTTVITLGQGEEAKCNVLYSLTY